MELTRSTRHAKTRAKDNGALCRARTRLKCGNENRANCVGRLSRPNGEQSISPVSATTHESPEAWPCHGIHTCLAFAPWRTATGSARIAGVSVLCRPHKCDLSDWSVAHNVLSPKTQIKVTSNFEVCWARPLISMQKRQHTRCSATDCCAHKPLDALPP